MAIVDVVKYNGNPDVFAWKFPSEDLSTWTQLIVNESQEAVLYKGGQALDVFGSGRHTLETANIPILNNIVNIPFGGKSPFAAEVWYVNKAHSLDIKWGTPTPIQLQDPKYGIFVSVRSFGQFGIKINDAKKFLIKLVGTLPQFTKKDVLEFFKGLYVTRVKDAISSYLIEKSIGVLEINAHLDELSQFMGEKLAPSLDEYGIDVVNFFINDISIPEDDEGVIKLKATLSKRAEMDILGFDYQQERTFDTLEGAATNPGSDSASMIGAGVGIGVGANIGGAIGNQMGGMMGVMNTSPSQKCPKCNGTVSQNQKFCGGCGYDMTTVVNNNSAKINCPTCGNDVDEGTKFCPECGGKLENACAACGFVVKGNSKFCPECGGKMGGEQPNE